MDISKKIFVWVIIGLIALRIILVVLAMNNIPFTDMKFGGFRPNFDESYRPDEQQYFEVAQGFSKGEVRPFEVNIGYPIFLTPIIFFTGAKSTIELAKIIFIIQEFFMFPLALILVMLMARRLIGSHLAAAISGLIFVFFPWLILTLGKIIGYDNAIPAFHHQLWIIIQSDYLSALLVHLTFFIMFRSLTELAKNRDLPTKTTVLLALTVGLALLVRMNNVWIFFIISGVLFLAKTYKKLFIYGFLTFLVYSPHLLFNWRAFGAPWINGYQIWNADSPPSGWFEVQNLWLNFSRFSPDNYFLWFLLAAAFFIFIFVFGFKHLYKTAGENYTISVGAFWFCSYLLFFGLFKDSLQSLRYFLPAVPVFIYFFIGSMIYLFRKLNLTKKPKFMSSNITWP